MQRVALVDSQAVTTAEPDDLLALDEALELLTEDARLRFLAGLSVEEVA